MTAADKTSVNRRSALWLVGPVLAAIYPVLSLFAQNWNEAMLRDVAPCLVLAVFGGVALAYAFRLVVGGRERGSLAAFLFLTWLFSYFAYISVCKWTATNYALGTVRVDVLFGVWLAAIVAPLAALRWGRPAERTVVKANQFVRLCCSLLVALATFRCLSLAMSDATGESAARASSAGAELDLWNDEPVVDAGWKAEQPATARDIYFMVFDRYASDATLKKDYQYDNSAFYEALENRGFRVYRECYTSYPMTILAMASTLNLRYLNPIFTRAADYAPAVDQHEAGRLLQRAGYAYHHIGNTFGPLRKSSIADSNLRVSYLPSEFADGLLRMTPIGGLFGPWFKCRQVRSQFAAVAAVADDPKLTFAYAHFLMPHDPYVFASDGSHLSLHTRPRADDRKAYIDQLKATNTMILETIDRLLDQSAEKPIIILQADEGPYLFSRDYDRPRVEQIAKRAGILSAALIPDEEIGARLPKDWASVNTFRFLLKEYFGAPLEPLANRHFYWETPRDRGTPIEGSRIVDVTKELDSVQSSAP